MFGPGYHRVPKCCRKARDGFINLGLCQFADTRIHSVLEMRFVGRCGVTPRVANQGEYYYGELAFDLVDH